MINREKTQALGNHELQRQLIISYNVTWQETAVHGREMDPDGGGGGGWGMGPSGHDTMLSQLLSGRGHAFGQGGGGEGIASFNNTSSSRNNPQTVQNSSRQRVGTIQTSLCQKLRSPFGSS